VRDLVTVVVDLAPLLGQRASVLGLPDIRTRQTDLYFSSL
jgi:hypothetical protein